MPDGLFDGSLQNIINLIGAAAGLGTASMGLVDASKAVAGGPSRFGFGFIAKAIKPFLDAGTSDRMIFGNLDVIRTLQANWINGVAIGEQKARARSLIHLLMTPENAAKFAALTGTDQDALTALMAQDKGARTADPGPAAIQALGHFDAVLSAILDEAFQRADQRYRNASKACAMGVSVGLSLLVANLIGAEPQSLQWSWSWPAFLIGLCATPLAPVAKDLTSSLQAASGALKIIKR